MLKVEMYSHLLFEGVDFLFRLLGKGELNGKTDCIDDSGNICMLFN